MSGILINPIQTTNAPGSFTVASEGLIQGTMYDDPSVRFLLTQGNIGGTIPLFGGYAVQELIPLANNPGNASPTLIPSTAVGNISALTLFNQSVGLINTPQRSVPVGSAGQSISFIRIGSNARVAVNCSPTLVSLDGGLISQQVSWDFTNQTLIPYVAAYTQQTPTAYSYTSATGILQLTFSPAPGPIAGDIVTLSGFTGANVVFNGAFTVVSTASAGTILNLQATAGLGSLTPSAGVLDAGGGAFPGKVLRVEVGNSMTITQSGGYYTWNQSGTCAVVLI